MTKLHRIFRLSSLIRNGRMTQKSYYYGNSLVRENRSYDRQHPWPEKDPGGFSPRTMVTDRSVSKEQTWVELSRREELALFKHRSIANSIADFSACSIRSREEKIKQGALSRYQTAGMFFALPNDLACSGWRANWSANARVHRDESTEAHSHDQMHATAYSRILRFRDSEGNRKKEVKSQKDGVRHIRIANWLSD